MNDSGHSGAKARGLMNFWSETGCYLLTNPVEGRRVGSIYKRDPISGVAVYLDNLENLIKPKSASGPFEYPKLDYHTDSNQINNASDFSDTQVRASFFKNINKLIQNALHIGGSWQTENDEKLVSYFLNNSFEEVPLGLLRGKVADYIFDTNRFTCDAFSEYFMVVHSKSSKKYAICSFSGKNRNFDLLVQLSGMLDIEAKHTFNSGEFSCALTSEQSQNGLTYAVKIVPLKCIEGTGEIKIEDPLTEPINFRPVAAAPTSEISELFVPS